MPAPTEQEFTAGPAAPGEARQFAAATLGSILSPPVSSELGEDVELVVSELVTNAVRAGSPLVAVSLGVENRRVVIRVTDAAAGWPEARAAGAHDTSGRGLPLISAVSAAWGVRMAEAGKVVWAELDIPASGSGLDASV